MRQKIQLEKKKVQLVLGSGGARGIAHIGVIQMLLDEGYEIVEIYGCSMGAIIGGMYACGILNEYSDWLTRQTKSDVYRLFDITFSMQGFLKGDRIFSIMEQMSGKRMIEDLPIKFTAVATDILHRKEVHFTRGDLYKALRASSGIPGVFTPVAHEKSLYVDGGVLNPLPVDLVPRRDDAIIVAVNLNGSVPHDLLNELSPAPKIAAEIGSEAGDVLSRMRNFFSWSKATEGQEIKAPEIPLPSLSMFEMLIESYDTSLDRLVQLMLQAHPVDMLIEVPRTSSAVFEFYRAAELIEVGKKAYRRTKNEAAICQN